MFFLTSGFSSGSFEKQGSGSDFKSATIGAIMNTTAKTTETFFLPIRPDTALFTTFSSF
jgi:hypothetical protein